LSITRIITEKEILEKDLSMYDCIVLYFWFGRNLSVIKRLPKKYKYCIILNAFCYYDCKNANRHWFGEFLHYPLPCKGFVEDNEGKV